MPPIIQNLLPLIILVVVWLVVVRPLAAKSDKRIRAQWDANPGSRPQPRSKNQLIWKVGVLYFGGIMFLFFTFAMPLIPHFTMGKPYSINDGFTTALVAFPLGAVFGWFLWRNNAATRP